MKKRNRT